MFPIFASFLTLYYEYIITNVRHLSFPCALPLNCPGPTSEQLLAFGYSDAEINPTRRSRRTGYTHETLQVHAVGAGL
jgi:hypothetical protein